MDVLSRRSLKRRIDDEIKKKTVSNYCSVQTNNINTNDQFKNKFSNSVEQNTHSMCELIKTDESYEYNKNMLPDNSLNSNLASWVVKNRISQNATNELLAILKSQKLKLPTDSRTLLKIDQNLSCENIDIKKDGHYAHLGLYNGLSYILKYEHFVFKNNSIPLIINVDGLPIATSSASQFWPILASVYSENNISTPFPIGIYFGSSKPESVSTYLEQFISEFQSLENEIIICDTKYSLKIYCIVCDAPAKCFLLSIKSFNGYFGCTRCVQEGEYVNGRVVYPEMSSELRTNEMFRNQSYGEDYHKGTTPLIKLNINLVSQVTLDYMHLVCLGVMKKLLHFWVRKLQFKMVTESIQDVSSALVHLTNYLPHEFSRLPRSLDVIEHWKATEYREFLLYTGPVVLKKKLPTLYYQHFMCLSIAIRILCSETLHSKYLNYARSLLIYFVTQYKEIYGKEYITHNVHNLIHLADDVEQFGSLDNFSAFRFENYLHTIKLNLEHCRNPLKQITNNILKQRKYLIKTTIEDEIRTGRNNIIYSDNVRYDVSEKNNCCLLRNKKIVLIKNIEKRRNEIILSGQLVKKKSFFKIPADSKKFDWFVITLLPLESMMTFTERDIVAKFVKCPYIDNSFVISPLLHTY